MPRIVNFTESDLLQGKLVTPGWYTVKVREVEDRQASTDGSTVYNFTLEIIEGEEKGVTATLWVSEKMLGSGRPLLEACGWKPSAGPVDFDRCVGKVVQVFIQRGADKKGKPINDPVQFREVKTAVVS